MNLIVAIDPGTRESALVSYDPAGRVVRHHVTDTNERILGTLCASYYPRTPGDWLVVEQVEAMGMAVGAETFETVWWAGRFHQAWRGRAERVTRREVKLHLCGSMRAKDPNIRQALLDKFGGASAIGKKASQGPLYGVKGHEFAALAVAITFAETRELAKEIA